MGFSDVDKAGLERRSIERREHAQPFSLIKIHPPSAKLQSLFTLYYSLVCRPVSHVKKSRLNHETDKCRFGGRRSQSRRTLSADSDEYVNGVNLEIDVKLTILSRRALTRRQSSRRPRLPHRSRGDAGTIRQKGIRRTTLSKRRSQHGARLPHRSRGSAIKAREEGLSNTSKYQSQPG